MLHDALGRLALVRPTPERGEYTGEVLRAFGFTPAQIAALRQAGCAEISHCMSAMRENNGSISVIRK